MKNKLYFVSGLFLKFMDVITTYFVVTTTGTIHEANPLVKYGMDNIGIINTLLIVFFVTAILLFHLYRKNRTSIVLLIDILLACVVVNNLFVVVRLLN